MRSAGLALVVVTLVASGCSGTGTAGSGAATTASRAPATGRPSATPGGTVAWREVALPGGVEPVTLTQVGSGVVVGAYAASRPRPRLLLVRDPTVLGSPGAVPDVTQVPVRPESPYAFEARWLAVSAHGGRLVAVGGARGGAHANVRWTVWAGTAAAVTEQPQPFGVFGGWGAGDLSGAAFAGDVPVVSGSWASEGAGNDVSLWRLTGDRWARQPSTGTSLGSTPSTLAAARSLASTGTGLVLSGSVTELAPGSVASLPAIWTAATADAPWTTLRLPATAALAEAHASRCEGADCLVVGQDGGRLAVWEVRGARVRRLPVPQVAVADHDELPAPVVVDGRDVVLAPGAVLVRDGEAWRSGPSPDGSPTAAVAVDGVVLVLTVGRDARSHLWVARP